MGMKEVDRSADYQRSYRDRMKSKGFAYVQVWVPSGDVERVKRYAKKLMGGSR